MFVLHGNVHDLVRCPERQMASDKLRQPARVPRDAGVRLVGRRAVVRRRAAACGRWRGAMPSACKQMMQYVTGALGVPATWPRDPDKMLDSARAARSAQPARRDGAATQADGLRVRARAVSCCPAGDLASLARGQAARLVRLLGWAANPYIKRVNIAFCLIAEKLSEVNDRLVQNPHVAAIEIPLPTRKSGRHIRRSGDRRTWHAAKLGGFTPESLAQNFQRPESGQSQRRALAGRNEGLDAKQFRKLKKTMIERQCQGLVEFVEPPHTLDLVVGQPEAKAAARARRRLDQRGAARHGADGLLCSAAPSAPARRSWPSATPARSAFPA